MYDTLIIGAGMSGIAAGIRLAHYDQKVCILERHYTIGGLNSFYRMNGRDYDVGLHAVTNFTPKGAKRGPLARLLRQLRFQWDDFALAPQIGSRIAFPGVALNFNNDFEFFRNEVAEKFPDQKDRFEQLLGKIIDYDDLDQSSFELSTRKILEDTMTDPLLIEMILCPLMWYGNAREHDMDFGQFCIMFRSIFMEGFARPFRGVRLILKNLIKRYRSLGGELRLRAGVSRIRVDGKHALGVILDDGTEIEAKRILSSAGRLETLRLCEDVSQIDERQFGQMSFIESISILNRKPKDLGNPLTIVFYNDSEKFHWERPRNGELCDVRTGVICSPNNYAYAGEDGELPEGIVRVTCIADYAGWHGLAEEPYRLAKMEWYERSAASSIRFVPDYRRHVIDTDLFTPNTIRRFTWHEHGAVYGAPDKKFDGTTHLDNLFLCGTDQGFVGIIGSIVSGISMANQHCLKD